MDKQKRENLKTYLVNNYQIDIEKAKLIVGEIADNSKSLVWLDEMYFFNINA
jgi:hypothetical protein